MRLLIILVMILVSSLFFQAGCAAYRAYPSKKLSRSEVAVLNVPWTNIIIDGSPIQEKYVSKIELLPGWHIIQWEYVYLNNVRELKQLEFVVEANHRYQLAQRFFPANGFDGVIGLVADLAVDTALMPLKLLIEENEPLEAPEGEYYKWITEQRTKHIIAGMAPNIVQAHQEITYVPIETP